MTQPVPPTGSGNPQSGYPAGNVPAMPPQLTPKQRARFKQAYTTAGAITIIVGMLTLMLHALAWAGSSDEQVRRSDRSAAQAIVVLGLLAGATLTGLGIGLVLKRSAGIAITSVVISGLLLVYQCFQVIGSGALGSSSTAKTIQMIVLGLCGLTAFNILMLLSALATKRPPEPAFGGFSGQLIQAPAWPAPGAIGQPPQQEPAGHA